MPGLVIYLAGADPFEGDRLGRLKLSFDGLRQRALRDFSWCWQQRIPLAFVMAGGYGQHIADTVQVQVQVQINTCLGALAYWYRCACWLPDDDRAAGRRASWGDVPIPASVVCRTSPPA